MNLIGTAGIGDLPPAIRKELNRIVQHCRTVNSSKENRDAFYFRFATLLFVNLITYCKSMSSILLLAIFFMSSMLGQDSKMDLSSAK